MLFLGSDFNFDMLTKHVEQFLGVSIKIETEPLADDVFFQGCQQREISGLRLLTYLHSKKQDCQLACIALTTHRLHLRTKLACRNSVVDWQQRPSSPSRPTTVDSNMLSPSGLDLVSASNLNIESRNNVLNQSEASPSASPLRSNGADDVDGFGSASPAMSSGSPRPRSTESPRANSPLAAAVKRNMHRLRGASPTGNPPRNLSPRARFLEVAALIRASNPTTPVPAPTPVGQLDGDFQKPRPPCDRSYEEISSESDTSDLELNETQALEQQDIYQYRRKLLELCKIRAVSVASSRRNGPRGMSNRVHSKVETNRVIHRGHRVDGVVSVKERICALSLSDFGTLPEYEHLRCLIKLICVGVLRCWGFAPCTLGVCLLNPMSTHSNLIGAVYSLCPVCLRKLHLVNGTDMLDRLASLHAQASNLFLHEMESLHNILMAVGAPTYTSLSDVNGSLHKPVSNAAQALLARMKAEMAMIS